MKKKLYLFCTLVLLFSFGLFTFHGISAKNHSELNKSCYEQKLQEKPYVINLSKEPEYLDFQESLLRESNIPKELYMPINYIGYLTQEEFSLCSEGCEQRTKALLMFLTDIYAGNSDVIKDGIIPKEIVEYALGTQGYKELVGKLNSETMAITCGSDLNLKRNKDGKIIVIEDNIGSLGGREDIYSMIDVFRQSFPDMPVVNPYTLQGIYIHEMEKWYKNLPGEYLIYCSDQMRSDETFAPKKEILEKIDVHFSNQDNVYVLDDKLYLKTESLDDIEISVLEHNGFDYSLDLSYDIFRERCESLDIPLDEYQDIPGSMQAVLKGNLVLGHAPGSSLADSKIVYPFVEDFIRYYLHEEPLLSSTKTFGLKVDDNSIYDMPSLSLEQAIAEKQTLVLKPIVGESGHGIVVGKNVDEKTWRKTLSQTYSKNAKDFLLFEYVAILEEDDNLLIHRFFVDAFQDKVSTRPGAYLRMKVNGGDGVVSTGNPGTISTGVLIEGINFTILEPAI